MKKLIRLNAIYDQLFINGDYFQGTYAMSEARIAYNTAKWRIFTRRSHYKMADKASKFYITMMELRNESYMDVITRTIETAQLAIEVSQLTNGRY